MSSAIKTPAFQAKAGNITNEDGSSIYSNGDWSLKNSSAVARVTIKDDGSVGIGTASPAHLLHIRGTSDAIVNVDSAAAAYTSRLRLNAAGAGASVIDALGGDNTLILTTNSTERMRIASNGLALLRVNTSDDAAGTWNSNTRIHMRGGLQLTHTGTSAKWRQLTWSGDTNDANLYFPNGSNTAMLTGTGAWINASDGRLKTEVTECKHGLSTVVASKPSSYKRIDSDGEFVGFIAQELKEVIPEVVYGSEDTQYGVDYGSLVAVAFKAIQEQQAMIEELKAKVSALESK